MIALIIQLWAAILIGFGVTLAILKIRNAGKTTVVYLRPTRTYKTAGVNTKGDKLQIKKDYTPNFTPLSIFQEEKSPIIFWRSAKRIVLLVENAKAALDFASEKGKMKSTDLSYYWSPEELREYIKKLAKKAAVETKPMSQSMYMVLLIVGVVNILFLLLIAMRLGVF